MSNTELLEGKELSEVNSPEKDQSQKKVAKSRRRS